jgi:hypothetical protein
MKETQELNIHIETNLDSVRINVTNEDAGAFKLNFLNPRTGKWIQSKEITANSNDYWHWRDAVWDQYWRVGRMWTDMDIYFTYHLTNGTETTNQTEAAYKSVLIQARKLTD